MSGTRTPPSTAGQLQFLPADRWMVERKFRFDTANPSGSPYTILLLDRQYYIAKGACFVRHVRQIHDEKTAENLRQIKIPFDPRQGGLTIHWIRIWRDGDPDEQVHSIGQFGLAPADGPRSIAHLTLDGLLPGDALDVAYSTTSTTRPNKNLFSAGQPINQRCPTLNWHLSAISPSDRRLENQCLQGKLEPALRELSEGSHYYSWHQEDVPPLCRVPNAPAWYQPNMELRLSNFGSWGEVASEINRSWEFPPASPETSSLASSIIAGADTDQWESARRICRFVQDEIATTEAQLMSPSQSPDETLDRRSGDAWDKAHLLVTLLRSIGIPSAPVLVNEARACRVRSALPTPDVFDHSIVRGRIGESDFWADPCATHQAGSISELAIPPYGVGLQISNRTKNLCNIPLPGQDANKLIITEHFIAGDGGHAKLSITTRASGMEANRLRAAVAPDGSAPYARTRQERLQARFPDASRIDNLTVEDDTSSNEIILREQFDIPELFTSGESGQGRLVLFPDSIRDHLTPSPLGTSPAYDHPWSLDFPCNLRHHIVIDTPWPAGDDEASEALPGTAFAFSFKRTTKDKRYTLSYAFNTLDDHIVPVDLPSARLRLEKIHQLLTYHIAPPSATTGQHVKSAKGARILSAKNPGGAVRERKSQQKNQSGLLLPILAAAAAVALFFVIRGTLAGRGPDEHQAVIHKSLAEPPAPPAPTSAERPTITPPSDLLSDRPPQPTAPDPEGFDGLEFGIGDGTEPTPAKLSKPTSGDWKLSK